MASTFNGQGYFNSGPHRFIIGRVGRVIAAPLGGSNPLPEWDDLGRAQLVIDQRGRLVAATTAALWTLIDAIRTATELPTTGTLIDHQGRSWPTMTLSRLQLEDRIDRGRQASVGYTALYIKYT